ncbi:MAG: hypothetical protein AAFW65_02375 [Pseudomonadota bacterium]
MAEHPDYGRLRVIQITAVIVGVVTLGVSLFVFGQFSKPEIAPIVICVALAGFGFGAVFYFGCLLFEGSLQKYIVSDDTVIKSETVELVTTTETSGDGRIDEWVNRYVFARNLFGMSLIPLLILGGLYIFA